MYLEEITYYKNICCPQFTPINYLLDKACHGSSDDFKAVMLSELPVIFEKYNIPLHHDDLILFLNPNFNNKSSFNTNVKHDIMDDYLEDLSFDEEEKPSSVIKEEAIVKKDNISDNVKTNDDVYVNKDEINKIMNEKENNDDDGFFDEFFE